MADFPSLSILPEYPLKEDREDNVIRSSFEGGYQHTRQKYSRRRRKYQLSYKNMLQADVNLITAFFDTTVSGGATSFNWTHPATSTIVVVRFTSPPAISLDYYGDAYRYSTEISLEEV